MDVFSAVFDRAAVRQSFPQVGVQSMVLAVLAGITPEAGWEGCSVELATSPVDPEDTVCVVLRGASADPVQIRLVEALEEMGIPMRAVYEGGPPAGETVAVVREGRWADV